MKLTNYHSHTNYCDGAAPPVDYIESAIKAGLFAYGFSSHAPIPYPNKWTMEFESLSRYIEEINNLKSLYWEDIQIYMGLEIDYIPEATSPGSDFIKSLDLDYTIGAVHFVDFFDDGMPWSVDGSYSEFLKGHDLIFKGDIKAIISRYYELIRLLTMQNPDIIAHLDKIKIHNRGSRFFDESSKIYRNEVEQTLDVIQEIGCIVEVNTRGFYQNKTDDFYPSNWIIKRLIERQIPITLNSDCHHPDEVNAGFNTAIVLLSSFGLKTIRVFIDSKWQDCEFNSNGIII